MLAVLTGSQRVRSVHVGPNRERELEAYLGIHDYYVISLSPEILTLQDCWSHARFATHVLPDLLSSYWSFQTLASLPPGIGIGSQLGFLIRLQFLVVERSLKRGQEGEETTTLLHLFGFILGIVSGLKILCVLFPVETQKHGWTFSISAKELDHQYQTQYQVEGATVMPQRNPKDTEVIATSLALQNFVFALAYGARAFFFFKLCPWCWHSAGSC